MHLKIKVKKSVLKHLKIDLIMKVTMPMQKY